MSRATLLDVAKHCGVSRATVSLVLNNSPLVADATRARVQQGLADLGYVYNRAAASLRTHRSDAIGVVLTQITNPYFAEFAAGLQDTLTESGTVPLLASATRIGTFSGSWSTPWSSATWTGSC